MKGINFPSKSQLYLIIGVLALVIFYLSRCRGVPQPQTITTTKILKDTLRLIEQDRKHITDSFNSVLAKHYAKDEQNNGEFVNLVNQNDELAQINTALQKQLDVPDTCKKYTDILNDSHNKYVSQTKQTIDKAKQSLVDLSKTVQTQKSFLTAKDTLYSRLKRMSDTCIANNAALEKYAKQVKPKRAITVNVQTISPYIGNIKPEFGGGIGYMNKKGLEISATYWSNQQISIRISKPLIRF